MLLFLGLRLQEKRGSSEPVVLITWSDKNQEFHCHIDDSETKMADGYDLNMEFLIKEAQKNGWLEIDKVYDVEP